ncbi:MAG: hypothetical protein P8X85_16940, partial [Desulfobacterales bacterium]
YIQPEGNYLEHEILQRGVLWGVGRLAHARPQYTRSIGEFVIPFLKSKDSNLRGLAAWVSGPARAAEAIPRLKELADDPARMLLYHDGSFDHFTVGELAREALARIYQVTDI